MKYLRDFEKKHPSLYILASILLVIGEIWLFFKVVHVSWIAAGILGGVLTTLTFDARRHVRPTIWSFAANIAASCAYVWLFFVSGKGWWGKCFTSLLFLPIFLLANAALKFDLAEDTRRRNRRAGDIVQQVLSGQQAGLPKYGLYLRPFMTTDRLPAQTLDPQPVQVQNENRRASHVDVETIFRRAFDRELDIIAVGRPEDILEGLPRVTITEEQDWRDIVLRLAESAAFLIVVPLIREGTHWELREVVFKRHLAKTLFLMPESQSEQPSGVVVNVEQDRAWEGGLYYYDSSEHYLDIYEEWNRAREVLQADGIFLPPWVRSGAMFTLDPNTGQVNEIAPLLLSLLTHQSEYLLTVLTEFGLLPWRQQLDTDLLIALEESTFQTARNREYVLTLAFELFSSLGDTSTAAWIVRRLRQIAGDHPLLIDQQLGKLVEALDPGKENQHILGQSEGLLSYLNALRNVNGIDLALVDQAIRALQDARNRSSAK